MKKISFILVFMAIAVISSARESTAPVHAQVPGTANSPAMMYKQTDVGVSVQVNSMNIEIQFYGPSIVRVVKSPEGKNVNKESLSVVKTPEKVTFNTRQRGNELLLKNKRLEVALNLQSGKVTFKNAKGQALLSEKEAGSTFTDFDDAGVKTHSVKQSYLLDRDETIYGLGILQNGKMSQRNQEVHMVQNNTWDFVTFFQSVKGYGLFWDNYSPTTFKDKPGETSFLSEVGECIDYYFMYGGDADGEFTLYEDENDNYNYEEGIYSTITFSWNDAKKELTIGDRKGSFPGMPTQREFHVVRVGENKANGMEPVEKFDRVVNYAGQKVKLAF